MLNGPGVPGADCFGPVFGESVDPVFSAFFSARTVSLSGLSHYMDWEVDGFLWTGGCACTRVREAIVLDSERDRQSPVQSNSSLRITAWRLSQADYCWLVFDDERVEQ